MFFAYVDMRSGEVFPVPLVPEERDACLLEDVDLLRTILGRNGISWESVFQVDVEIGEDLPDPVNPKVRTVYPTLA